MGVRTQILVIEDDSNDEALMMRMLRKAYLAEQVKIISDGHAAADYLVNQANEAEDLMAVFLDLKLPSLGGIHLLKIIRAHDRIKHLPVIVMTSSESSAQLEECRRLGVHSYVQKPVTFSAFASAVANTFPLVGNPAVSGKRSRLGE